MPASPPMMYTQQAKIRDLPVRPHHKEVIEREDIRMEEKIRSIYVANYVNFNLALDQIMSLTVVKR